ncbi:GILT-like protein 1 [Cylas formicarius]|uniref:GILT-like protein 1 n=1 Tax=Cylas formicarius TaxID=197179 RepID=UPI0029583E16|nr:GILT-like protein 1 [Cylas formicarius]XP_060533673.1 GILT-like protein 1 [Cylas formicarius]
MEIFKAGLIFCLVFVVVSAQHDHAGHEGHNHEDHMVNVAVYYESLCPDSRKFFTQQLYPSLQGNLSHYVNLTLVPYGKATMEFKTNEHEFTCHHGPSECLGNKIQACALHLIEQGRKTQGLGFNRVTVGFINCLMDKAERNGDQATFPTKDCAELNHVAVLDLINNCAHHTDASNYLANYGALTDAIQKPLKYVPTIVFNNQYKQEDNTLAQTNFVKALCQYINGEKPMECSGASSVAVSLGFLILSGMIPRLFR